jgi:hypothetical protein
MGFIIALPIYWAPFFKQNGWHRFRGFGKKNWINERIGLKYWIYLIWCFMGYCGLFRRVLIICMVNKLDEIFGNIGFIDLDNNIGSITGLN